jgi:hypothetical protein
LICLRQINAESNLFLRQWTGNWSKFNRSLHGKTTLVSLRIWPDRLPTAIV